MTILYICLYLLLLWPIYEYFKNIVYVSPEEAKKWNRLHLKARGNIIGQNVNVKSMALETYDYLIIESLNYQTK